MSYKECYCHNACVFNRYNYDNTPCLGIKTNYSIVRFLNDIISDKSEYRNAVEERPEVVRCSLIFLSIKKRKRVFVNGDLTFVNPQPSMLKCPEFESYFSLLMRQKYNNAW